MRIQNNIPALNTHRNLSFNNAQTAKNLEKLSSGFKINRAGDDAAGLAISEKMRGQIRGLDMASKNSNDAISLIQTAEGALNETHSILQRMREIAVQSASDTNVKVDRTALQTELTQLTEEIDRIANTTEFNTQKLLDGSFKGTFQIGANEGQNINLNIDQMGAAALGLTATTTVDANVAKTAGTALADGTYKVSGTGVYDVSNNNQVASVSGDAIKLTDGTSNYQFTRASGGALTTGSTITVQGGNATLKAQLTGNGAKLAAGDYSVVGSQIIKDNNVVGSLSGNTAKITVGDTTVTVTNADLKLSGALTSGSTFKVNGVEVSTRQQAAATITTVNSAIETVSAQRSRLGAVQNRLEHTINNLGAASENLTAAESRIRDTDMAKEMMQFTKNNILSQAAQAMLAQANQQPQGVLQLLR